MLTLLTLIILESCCIKSIILFLEPATVAFTLSKSTRHLNKLNPSEMKVLVPTLHISLPTLSVESMFKLRNSRCNHTSGTEARWLK